MEDLIERLLTKYFDEPPMDHGDSILEANDETMQNVATTDFCKPQIIYVYLDYDVGKIF